MIRGEGNAIPLSPAGCSPILGNGFLCVFASWREILVLEVGVRENDVAKQIVDAAYQVHTHLGPGLLESVYEAVLAYELERRGLRVVRQQPIPVVYEGMRIETGFRADLIVDDRVIVEIKSVEAVAPVHKKQVLTHLRLADKRLGLLINFNVVLIKEGITRIANGIPD